MSRIGLNPADLYFSVKHHVLRTVVIKCRNNPAFWMTMLPPLDNAPWEAIGRAGPDGFGGDVLSGFFDVNVDSQAGTVVVTYPADPSFQLEFPLACLLNAE